MSAKRGGLAALLFVSAATACAETPAPAAPIAPPVAVDKPAVAPKAAPALRVSITPNASAMVVDVTLEFAGPIDANELVLENATAAGLTAITARDDGGDVAVRVASAAHGEGVVLALAHKPAGALLVSYRVAATPASLDVDPRVEIDGDRMRASGRALFALPAKFCGTGFDAEIAIAQGQTAQDPATGVTRPVRAASSFGVGTRQSVVTTTWLLRDALYVTGVLGEAQFDAPEGHDEAAWTGYTAFDPRPIAADVAAFRTAARDALKEKGNAPAAFLILPDARPRGRFVASRRAGSVVLNLGPGEPWTGALRIAVATEVLKRWIGGEAQMGDHELWFAEGVSRSLARSMSFRFGVVTPAELLDEVHGLEAVVRTSRLRDLGDAQLAVELKKGTPGVVSLLVARGALYATRVDAILREKSGGKRSLEDVARALLAKARERRAPLTHDDWLDALQPELDRSEAAAFGSAITQGHAPSVPDHAFGPCFAKAARRYGAYELGFDLEATGKAKNKGITGLLRDGPAMRAGLTGDETLVDADVVDGRSDRPVVLTVELAGKRRTVRYLPATALVSGEGWTRKRDIADDVCAR